MSNTEKTQNDESVQNEQKGTSNRFKRAAEKKKKTAGGKPEELTAGATGAEEEIPAAVPEVPEAPVAQEQAPPAVPAVKEERPAVKTDSSSLAHSYEATMTAKPEARTARLNILITPTIDKKLNDLAKGRVEGRTILSKNDLINFLLERYFKEIGL